MLTQWLMVPMSGSTAWPMSTLTLGASDPVGHVVDHKWFVSPDGWWIWSGAMTVMAVAALILVIGGAWVARQIETGPESEGNERYITRNPFAQLIEVVCLYLRDDIVRPLLHERTDRFMPFLWSLFFFILVCNLLGLVPFLDAFHLLDPDSKKAGAAFIGGTPTQSLYVTGAMALIAGLVINGAGIASLGLGGYVSHLTAGAPWYIWPITVPVEILGTLVKPFALAIRLFANMTAGHILLAQLLIFSGAGLAGAVGGLMGTDGGMPAVIGLPVWLVATAGSVAIFFLEIFVGFLQAFIFMFLTTVFISLLSHHDESHDHAEHAAEDEDIAHAGEPHLPGAVPGATPALG